MTEHTNVAPAKKRMGSQRAAAILVAIIGIAAMTAVGIAIFKPLIASLEDPAVFQAWIDRQGTWGRLVFIGIMALQVIIAWLPGEPLELGAGYAFGFWEGSLLCMAGIVLGSVIVFLLVRTFGRRIVSLFFSEEKLNSIPILKDTRRLTWLSFIVFMIPGTPKDILTYCAGLTAMKLPAWLLIAGVARIPPVITSTLSGSALGKQQYGVAIIVFAATMVLSLLGLLLYRHIERRAKGGAQA